MHQQFRGAPASEVNPPKGYLPPHRDRSFKIADITAPARPEGNGPNISSGNAQSIAHTFRLLADGRPHDEIKRLTGISATLFEQTLDIVQKLLDLHPDTTLIVLERIASGMPDHELRAGCSARDYDEATSIAARIHAVYSRRDAEEHRMMRDVAKRRRRKPKPRA
ncbi:MAG TPA: hypothetical protein VHC22_17900 [Pirellulales bacterium]|nr:hypothetical protein [Pirellulales bacterium]